MAEELVAIKNGDATNEISKAVTFTSMKPLLFVEAPKANDAVLFYKAAFGAEEVNRVSQPKRKADQEVPLVVSAETKLGGTTFVVTDLVDGASELVKRARNTASVFVLETDDVDAAVEKAVKAGAIKEEGEVDGLGYGGRSGKVEDPYGNLWIICSAAEKKADAAEAEAEA